VRVVVALLIAGCTSEVSVPREVQAEGVVAEVHIHQYERGSHASAAFVHTKVPFREELDEMLVHFAVAPDARDGVCRLDTPSVCEPTCPGETQFCDRGVCKPFAPLRFENGGLVRVTGSSLAPINLTFDDRLRIYRSDRSPIQPLYVAGDRLHVEADGQWPIRAEITAPAMAKVTTPLLLPTASWPVTWSDAPDGQVVVRLLTVGKSGESVYITCLDSDRGSLTIPASMMARLPGAPRWIQLEVERRHRERLPLGNGRFAVVTVATTWVADRNE
jgi:hypothetical protein